MFRRHKFLIIGTVLGLVLGGGFSLVFGVVAGFAIDRMRVDLAEVAEAERVLGEAMAREEGLEAKNDVAFSVGVVVLSAKLAKADGRVSTSELQAFHRVFYVPPESEAATARLFDKAVAMRDGPEAYAQELARIFGSTPELLEDLLEGLVRIASADGALDERARSLLLDLARIFGIESGRVARLLERGRDFEYGA